MVSPSFEAQCLKKLPGKSGPSSKELVDGSKYSDEEPDTSPPVKKSCVFYASHCSWKIYVITQDPKTVLSQLYRSMVAPLMKQFGKTFP